MLQGTIPTPDLMDAALVSPCGSALARRVPRRGGRNARPVSSGPSGPTRGQAGAPAAAVGRLPSRLAGVAARRYDLDAGVCRAGGISRRVRASAERGRVQGPGRAEADLQSLGCWIAGRASSGAAGGDPYGGSREPAEGRSHSDALVGATVRSTTASSSAERASRSICSRSRAANASTVRAAS